MFKNYLKVTFRNFRRNKVSTIINLLGLTVGISTCIIVFLLIDYELSFDSFHSKGARIYRVVSLNETGEEYSGSVPYPMGSALLNDYPELEAVTQIFGPTDYQVQLGTEKWDQKDVMFADSSFFEVFDYNLMKGNKLEALKEPNKVIITESLAKNHFKDTDAIGKVIRLNNLEDLEVVGIMNDPPSNSNLNFSMVVSFQTLSNDFIGEFDIKNWQTTIGIYNYVVLPKNVTVQVFNERLKEIPVKYTDQVQTDKKAYYLQPLKEIHFDKRYASSNSGSTIDMSFVWVIGCIGLFIITIACINFINLSTALAVRKSKEVGIRKVLGAYRGQLMLQYLGEAFLLTVFSVFLSLGIVERMLPLVNKYLNTTLYLDIFLDPSFFLFLFLLILLVSVFSGLYPALVLSSYSPYQALKSKITDNTGSSVFLRKGLVAFQFVISQVLIIGTLVISSQMKFFRDKPLGFDKDHIIKMSLSDNDPGKLSTFKNEILSDPHVKAVSFAIGTPTSENSINTNFHIEGSEENMNGRLKAVDFDYQKTFDLQLAAGKWFTSERKGQKGYEIIINETAVRKIGFTDPQAALGVNLLTGFNKIKAPIVGVVKDFHMQSLRDAIEPMFMLQSPKLFFEGGIKVRAEDMPATLSFIETKWNEVFPEYIFDYEFLDVSLAKNYKSEQTIFNLLKVLSGIAIFIGCLGLIGLVSFLVNQKSKEVGVRKVLGASSAGIFILFSKDYFKLIIIAFIIAAPASWWAMDEWLSSFAYRIKLTPQFLLTGVLLNSVIAIATVGYQSIKAALANPVDSLRDE